MPFLEMPAVAGTKRKRSVVEASSTKQKATDVKKEAIERIAELEKNVIESRKNYNDIVNLLKHARDSKHEQITLAANIALCRVFGNLLAVGSLTKLKSNSESETAIFSWLKERYREYQIVLLGLLRHGSSKQQEDAITLLMRLIKEDSTHLTHHGDAVWRQGLFLEALRTVVERPADHNQAVESFRKTYLEYDDIRYWTWKAIETILDGIPLDDDETTSPDMVSNCFLLLMTIDAPSSDSTFSNFFGHIQESKNHQARSLNGHKKQAQAAWMCVIRNNLSKDQRKAMLSNMTERVVPWFTQVDLLMDFLTTSYNVGGGTSLLALSGLFHLIQERNLDYPSFYTKLYSLLDDGLLHSKHRSRFFRLLDVFLSSSHLPAQLVASFIKRLARRALHAPPAGIVVVVPWIYNMLKTHPQCTFMIHRDSSGQVVKEDILQIGKDDPFDADEVDPMLTDAIESSLWEIETLQSHYHPNVATLAKIISDPFTKQSYNLEDFLDHSYDSLLHVELKRDLKKAPVVEWEIPKRIFTTDDGLGLNSFGTLLQLVETSGTT